MTIAEVATYLGIMQSTVRAYMARKHMPEPDLYVGNTPVWHRATIEQWASQRPGRGRRSPHYRAPTEPGSSGSAQT